MGFHGKPSRRIKGEKKNDINKFQIVILRNSQQIGKDKTER